MVTSAAGLAMLLVVSVYPVLIGLGVSGVASAAVISSVLIHSYAPSSAIAVFEAKTAGIDPMEYLIGYQLLADLPGAIAAMIAHVLIQCSLDAKGLDVVQIVAGAAEKKNEPILPGFYALLPLVPLILLFIFNKLVYKSIVLDVATAMSMGWVFALLVDWCYRRDTAKVFADGAAMFKGMGEMLTSVVGLIFVAALFAKGLQNTGFVDLLVNTAKGAGLGLEGTGLIMSGVIGLVTILTGSGVASFTSLAPLAPSIADSFGSSPVELTLMMQIASECLLPVSPVAGVVIIVAGFAKVSPLAVVKRNLIPCLVAVAISTSIAMIMMG